MTHTAEYCLTNNCLNQLPNRYSFAALMRHTVSLTAFFTIFPLSSE